jgi:hypothetical protein
MTNVGGEKQIPCGDDRKKSKSNGRTLWSARLVLCFELRDAAGLESPAYLKPGLLYA